MCGTCAPEIEAIASNVLDWAPAAAADCSHSPWKRGSMPSSSTPTERQKRLGAELRKMRVAAEATTSYAAGLLGIDRTKISNMEGGVRPISPARVRTLACNYACAEALYVDAL